MGGAGEVGGAREENKDTEEETVPEAMDGDTVSPQGKDIDSTQPSPSPTHPEPDPGSYSPAMLLLNKETATPERPTPSHNPSYAPKLSESEEIQRVPNPTVQPPTVGYVWCVGE